MVEKQGNELLLYFETIWPDDAYLYDKRYGESKKAVDIYLKGSFLGHVANSMYASKIHFIGWPSFESKLQGYQPSSASSATVCSCKCSWESWLFYCIAQDKSIIRFLKSIEKNSTSATKLELIKIHIYETSGFILLLDPSYICFQVTFSIWLLVNYRALLPLGGLYFVT